MHTTRNIARFALIAAAALLAAPVAIAFSTFAPEHVAAGLMLANAPVAMPEVKQLLDKIMQGFEEFKKTNDERLSKVEKGAVTGDVEAKLAQIQKDVAAAMEMKKDLEALEAKANLQGLVGGKQENPDRVAYKDAFFKGFVRKGDEINLKELEAKAWTVGTAADGGYALPIEQDRAIEKLLRDMSPMRSVANVISVSTPDYRKLVNKNGVSSGWVGETDARPQTNTSQFVPLTPFMGELYANPQVSQQALDDLFFDVEGDLISQLVEEFSIAEGAAYVSGDGVKKPKGFLAYGTAATGDAARAFGTLEHIATGVAGDFPANNKADWLIDIISKIKAGYRNGASWAMGKSLMFEIMKLKDTTGQYLWQPRITDNGLGLLLLGYGVTEMEDMPAKAVNSLSIAFGNFKRGYTIVDRVGMRVLRDPYTNKPYVGFYTTKRVGGMLVNSEAIKVGKFGTA